MTISGAIDDVWVDKKGNLIIVDYKATSKDGKLNASDAKIIANKIAEQGRKEFEETVANLLVKLRETSSQADNSAHAKITALQERIRELEKQLSHPPTRSGEP